MKTNKQTDKAGVPHKQCTQLRLSVDLSSSSNSRRTALNSTPSNSSTSSLAINGSSSATTSSNSRARQVRVSSSRAPNTEVDSLVVDLVDTRNLDTLGDRVSFAALDLDLSAGVVEFSLLVVGTVDGDVFAADEVLAIGLWKSDELASKGCEIGRECCMRLTMLLGTVNSMLFFFQIHHASFFKAWAFPDLQRRSCWTLNQSPLPS
jgi:hypothetical protein